MIERTGKNKKIYGRDVPEFVLDKFTRKIKKSGSGAAVGIPRRYLGNEAKVTIIGLQPFVCVRCIDTFARQEDFSPNPKLCKRCYEAVEFLKENKGKLKCKDCGKTITEEEYRFAWDVPICEKCWLKEVEEDEKSNEKEEEGSEEL